MSNVKIRPQSSILLPLWERIEVRGKKVVSKMKIGREKV